MKRDRLRGSLGLTFAAAGAGAWMIKHVTAPAVRVWRPGRGKYKRAGDLVARITGSNRENVTVLLHGLIASGDTFGDAFNPLASESTLVVPDLLGFGRSMDTERTRFALCDRLDALDRMLDALGLSESRLTIGGHSLGALIALQWAARRRAQVDALTLWSTPLFRNQAEARERLKRMGWLEALFAQGTRVARISCQLMCALRPLARAAAVMLSPDLPIAISSKAVSHTWPAYRDSMAILLCDWAPALRRLEAASIPITLMAGTRDPSQVPGRARQLAADFSGVRDIAVPRGTHILPITHGALCAQAMSRPQKIDDGDVKDHFLSP